jgi:adenine-specific DNA methylase
VLDTKDPCDVDICIFDPPYFDYIAYSELSEFYRMWWREHDLSGSPLLPSPTAPITSFGHELGACLRATLARLKPQKPLIFTYHSSDSDAWEAIGLALDDAKLSVTALWPVLTDAHMGHHTAEGNCEWDLVVVCRRATECEESLLHASLKEWRAHLRPLRISKADQESMKLAIDMATRRFGLPRSKRVDYTSGSSQ